MWLTGCRGPTTIATAVTVTAKSPHTRVLPPKWTPVRILGDVPLDADGSTHFQVPADLAMYFQLLDENRMEMRRDRLPRSTGPGLPDFGGVARPGRPTRHGSARVATCSCCRSLRGGTRKPNHRDPRRSRGQSCSCSCSSCLVSGRGRSSPRGGRGPGLGRWPHHGPGRPCGPSIAGPRPMPRTASGPYIA